jgi:ABC-2 type transport system permease protein
VSNYAPIVIAVAAVLVIVSRLQRRGLLNLKSLGRRNADNRPRPKSNAPPRLGEIGLVAGREVRQRLRGRTFRIATGLLLVGVAAAVVIPVITKGHSQTEQVGIVGASTPSTRHAVAAAGRTADTDTNIVIEHDLASAEQALRSGSLDVAVIDGRRILVHKAATADDSFPRALAGLLGLASAARDAGLSTAQAAKLAHAQPLPVTSLEPAIANGAGRSTAAIGMIAMFILLTQYLTWTLIGVMEEKSNRVVEVLLATVRPLQLLSGKVLGIGIVVFAQAAIVGAFAFVLARIVGSDLLHGTAPLVLLSTVVWLLLGYAFYSWLYAGAGSTMERQDQVQTLAVPLGLPLIASYILGITVSSSGTAPIWFEVLAYLPPSAPFAMTTLVGLGEVEWWQFVLSAAITIVCACGVARLAAAVYRRAILRTGKRVPLRDLIRR